jgi:hypothetical protein
MRRRVVRGRTLNATEATLLGELARTQFATADQLAIWCRVSKPALSLYLKALHRAGLVETGADTKPQIWQLTLAGAARMQVPMPSGRRHSSWAVMQNAAHRNAGDTACRAHRSTVTSQLPKKGFNLPHGEHAGRTRPAPPGLCSDDFTWRPGD